MTFAEWAISTVSSTVLLGFGIYLAKNVIATRLTTSVQHEFDAKLAQLSTEHRKTEETFKADLAQKQAEISALQNGILSGRAARLAAVDKRRLEAVDQIWGAVQGLAHAKLAAASFSVMKFEALLREASKNPKARQLVAHIDTDTTKSGEAGKLAERAHPYLSDMAWAYFYAYQAILLHSQVRVHMVKAGLDMPHLIDDRNVLSLIKVALPHCSDYIDKHGVSAAYYLLDQLESSLLGELRKLMDGSEADLAGVKRAKEILEAASKLSLSPTDQLAARSA